LPSRPGIAKTKSMKLPDDSRSYDDVLADMATFTSNDADYKNGRTWSLVYYLGQEHTDFLQKAHGLFFSENGLNPMAFQSLKRFESEVVSMTAAMLNGDHNVCGTMTSGGTESCLLAVKTYRDLARATRPRVRRPEMIVPESIHVAFEKAADYFGVKAVHVPVMANGQVNVARVKRKITRNTILLVGSAPSYPHGIVDPIDELGKLAQRKGLPLHVDGCLGGFLLPFVEALGYPVPRFDFRVPGVTSMTADVHKYGYSAKGASVILYRDVDFLKHQLFVYENWPGGIFASPGLLGTRPGGAIAAAWAAMQSVGREGYLAHARTIMTTAIHLRQGIEAIPGLAIVGNPHMSVLAYRSTTPDINIYAVGDQLEARGWHIDRQQRPECLHLMVTPHHADVADDFLADLAVAVEAVRGRQDLATSGSAAMYGMIAHIPIRRLVKENVLKMMLDLYGPSGQQPQLDAEQDDLASRLGLTYLKLRDAWQRWRR
jgi:sphinganine-1-phosphate aldolase